MAVKHLVRTLYRGIRDLKGKLPSDSALITWKLIYEDIGNQLTASDGDKDIPAETLPSGRRLWLLRHGFRSIEHVLYELDKNVPQEYLPFTGRKRTELIDGRWEELFRNKMVFYYLMGWTEVRVPTVYGLIKRGQFHHLPPCGPSSVLTDDEKADSLISTRISNPSKGVKEYLQREKQLILKPAHGAIGKDVFLCEMDEDSYQLNGEQLSEEEFDSKISSLDDFITVEYMTQAPYAEKLFPEATNTIRILTVQDVDTGKPFIPIAGHRIGTTKSMPVDNFSQGGLSAKIDLQTGELSEGIQYPEASDLHRFRTHPNSGAKIEGTTVPNWPSIVDQISSLAESISYLPYIGWDVLVTGEGEDDFVIIEANCSPGVQMLQVHEPLLTDQRMRRFYRKHDVI